MRRLIRTAHEYIGLGLSVFFLVFGVTGTALVYKEAYWRWAYPEMGQETPALTSEAQASGIRAAIDRFGPAVRSIKLPEPGVPAYHLYLTEGEAFLSLEDHKLIDEWGPRNRLMGFLFDLHAHLLAGENGERVGGFISLFGILLSVTGLILWWPARKQFSLRNMVPRDSSRRGMIAWHRDVGLIASPLLLVVLLSGSGLVFYTTAGRILDGLLGGTDPIPAAGLTTSELQPALANTASIERVHEEFPDARIVFYYPPAPGVLVNEFRLKRPCELHSNGRTYVSLDTSNQVVSRTDACLLGNGERALHTTYPLHSGKTPSAIYKFLVFLSGIAMSILAGSGVVAYGRKLFAGKRRDLTLVP